MFEKANHIEDVLNSLDGIKRAEAGPYFYNRIQEKLRSPLVNDGAVPGKLVLQPAFVISLLFLILLLDGWVMQLTYKQSPGKSQGYVNSAESGYPFNELSMPGDFEELIVFDRPSNE